MSAETGLRELHFLHIGKNAGTEIHRYIQYLNGICDDVEIIKHRHDFFLGHLPFESEYFFSIRNPISRFRSGFYSRKRKGQPRLLVEWSPYDAQAFADFEHANDLAEALFRKDERGQQAFAAIKSIRHTAQNQVDWFYCCGNFLKVKPPFAIIRQEHLDEDILALQSRLGVEVPVILPRNATSSHVNNYEGVPEFSDKAIANLEIWYAQDFELYRACNDWIEAGGNQ